MSKVRQLPNSKPWPHRRREEIFSASEPSRDQGGHAPPRPTRSNYIQVHQRRNGWNCMCYRRPETRRCGHRRNLATNPCAARSTRKDGHQGECGPVISAWPHRAALRKAMLLMEPMPIVPACRFPASSILPAPIGFWQIGAGPEERRLPQSAGDVSPAGSGHAPDRRRGSGGRPRIVVAEPLC